MATTLAKNTDQGGALATVQPYAVLAERPREIAEMLLSASGGQRVSAFELDVLKVPSGQGAALWSVPTLSGEDENVKSIEGIAIVMRTTRSYWKLSMEESGGGSPPDCTSQDGQTGRGDPGGDCADCPMAEFGSAAKGSGQACKQNSLLFLFRPDALVPMVIKAPPTSLKPMKQFVLRLMNERVPLFGAVLSFSLQKMKGNGTPDYYQIVPSLVRKLGDEEVAQVKALREALLPVLAGVRIEAE
jgi:hypothetical protein